MTDKAEPDGAYDWPYAVGPESKARQWRLARGIHDTEMRSGDKIDELLEEYGRAERADRPLTMAAIEELVSELKASKAEIARLRGLLEAAEKFIKFGRTDPHYRIKKCRCNAHEALAAYDKTGARRDKGKEGVK